MSSCSCYSLWFPQTRHDFTLFICLGPFPFLLVQLSTHFSDSVPSECQVPILSPQPHFGLELASISLVLPHAHGCHWFDVKRQARWPGSRFCPLEPTRVRRCTLFPSFSFSLRTVSLFLFFLIDPTTYLLYPGCLCFQFFFVSFLFFPFSSFTSLVARFSNSSNIL
ncbi:uncharacterized protein EI90DRAFT_768357 [Cantharellus anzutake]|uniref:uncharacterized protein n=1 Tax=Cantharellus anzutake TaxID=1750568 RepID=UPI001906B39D|nr:uncharacterized protein EI90DRAFT_768357 [Cantharellus anzutake]KAF8342611.1 hypothetical protein EI90DRAFT_768357 [Cantharellus anzutake]